VNDPRWTPSDVGELLIESLPYIQRFAGQIVVIKYGGNAMAGVGETAAINSFAQDVALLKAVGLRPVVVHGGGPQISSMMERLGKKPEFRNGLRVTDAETMEIASMVLLGNVNPQLVNAINAFGAHAVGVSGQDSSLLLVRQRDPDLGFVGEIVSCDPTVVQSILDDGSIPVIATIGSDGQGQAFNVNADTAAASIAGALGARKVLYLTDVPGVLRDRSDVSTLVHRADREEIERMIAERIIDGGMIPKVESCLLALDHGVSDAHILDGRIEHVLLIELFTQSGVGTMIESSKVTVV
jgi:acetylglutamate kinase